MKTEDRRLCPSCGNEFSGTLEFCPVCMLREVVAGEFGESSPAEQERVESTSTRIPHWFEHYELMSDEDGKPVELARGAMGVTYKAFDVNLQMPGDIESHQRKVSR